MKNMGKPSGGPRSRNEQKVESSVGLVSIGYEGRTALELLQELQRLQVAVLVDVRLTPISRKPGLSKTRLGEALRAFGIDYCHLPALGNPKDNREPFWTGDVSLGCIRFSELLTRPQATSAMDQLEAYARDCLTAVLCFEREHERCHRQVIVGEVSARLGVWAPVIHA